MRLFLGGLGIACLISMSSTVSDAADEVVIKVTAKELLTDYQGSETEKDPKKKFKAADAKYKGKMVEVSGVMKGKVSNNTIVVEGGTAFKATISCAFGTQDKEKLLALEKAKTIKEGISVTIRGTCNGLNGALLKLDDCLMVDPPFKK